MSDIATDKSKFLAAVEGYAPGQAARFAPALDALIHWSEDHGLEYRPPTAAQTLIRYAAGGRVFWSVVAPALRPAAAVLGLLTFMERWNDFLWPYLTLDPDHPTVQVALSRLSGGYYTDQALIMAGTLLGTIPLVVVFVLFGRQIIGGIMEGGLK